MKVFPDKTDEYIKRHNPIWKALEEVLKLYGVTNYSIFFDDETHMLFGYVEVLSEAEWDSIAESQVCVKWWNFMKDIMETNTDNSPKSKSLIEVFHLD